MEPPNSNFLSTHARHIIFWGFFLFGFAKIFFICLDKKTRPRIKWIFAKILPKKIKFGSAKIGVPPQTGAANLKFLNHHS